jgi:hypothetical protein
MNIPKNELTIHSKLTKIPQIMTTRTKWTLDCSLPVEETKIFEIQRVANKLVS